MEHVSFRLVKPSGKRKPRTAAPMPLSTCDLALPNVYAMAIFAFEIDQQQQQQRDFVTELENGLADALDEYPEWAGRLRILKDHGSSLESTSPATSTTTDDAAAEEGDESTAVTSKIDAPTSNISRGNVVDESTSSNLPTNPSSPASTTVIDFTDDGVALMEANMLELCVRDLMPFDPSPMLFQLVPATQSVQELLLIQVTRFKCGGYVVGVAWHHRLADGQAFFAFMDNWARITRGADMVSTPFHDRSLVSPAADDPLLRDEFRLLSPQNARPQQPQPLHDHLVAKKFHFSSETIEELRQEASNSSASSSDAAAATRFESLTAHLWRCITRARALEDGTATQIMIPLDARSRLQPALPSGYFGNATFAPSTPRIPASELLVRPLSDAAAMVHSAVAKADDAYLRSALRSMQVHQCAAASAIGSTVGSDAGSDDVLVPPAMSPDVCVSSWVRFPLYEVDFGWGAPLFVGNVLQMLEGIMVLLPSYTRDSSIDAVVALFAPAMDRLQQQLEHRCEMK